MGEDLQDHIDCVLSRRTPSKEFLGDSMTGNLKMVKAIIEHRIKRTGVMTTCIAEGGGFWKSSPDLPAPDIQYHFIPALLEDHGREKVKGHGFSCHACVLRPESRGTVRLGSNDAAAAPVIDPEFLSDERDLVTLRGGMRQMYRIFGAPSLAKYGGADTQEFDIEDDDALDAVIREKADTVYHPVGTCRMGSDKDAVVDTQLRLNGIDGLYVADASIMPRLVSGNTNAPSIMIGEKCADFVRADLMR